MPTSQPAWAEALGRTFEACRWLRRTSRTGACLMELAGFLTDRWMRVDEESDDDRLGLSKREIGVLYMRIVEGRLLREVAECYGVSKERIRQIEGKAMRRLLYPTRVKKWDRNAARLAELHEELSEVREDCKRMSAQIALLRRGPGTATWEEFCSRLSVRTYNALHRAGIRSLEDLLSRSARDLVSVRGFGVKCLEDVRSALEIIGCRLAGDEDS